MNLYEILALKANNGVKKLNRTIEDIKTAVLIEGVATGGTTNSLIDNTKNFEVDLLIGKTIVFTIDGVTYTREILGNMIDTIGFIDTLQSVGASATIGTGIEPEGQFVISCIGSMLGEVGNEYSFQVIETERTLGEVNFELDEVNKILKVLVDKNGIGESQQLAVGSLQMALSNSEFNDRFSIENEFITGSVAFMAEPVSFEDGIDGVVVTEGTKYTIYDDLLVIGRFKEMTFTTTVDNTTNIVHDLVYDSVHDDLLVFYNGILLTKTLNYTENVDGISIDLVDWNIDIGESIYFKLYKNVK